MFDDASDINFGLLGRRLIRVAFWLVHVLAVLLTMTGAQVVYVIDIESLARVTRVSWYVEDTERVGEVDN